MIPCSQLYQDTWKRQVSGLQFRAYNETLNKYLTIIGYSISRKKDYRLSNTLIGECSITVLGRVEDFDINNKILIQAGFNNEYITIFTGYIDRISENIRRRTSTIKMRDRLKMFDRRLINPNEYMNSRVKDLLDAISNDCGIPTSDRYYDDPDIIIDYFAPKKKNALDEARKLVEATVDSEFYSREDDKIIFKSYIPSTQYNETWDTDTDFLAKKTSISKMEISEGKLFTRPGESNKLTSQAVSKSWSWGGPVNHIALYTQRWVVNYPSYTVLKSFTLYQKAALPMGEQFEKAQLRVYARHSGKTTLVLQDISDSLRQALSTGTGITTITYNLEASGDQFIIEVEAYKVGNWNTYSQPKSIEGQEVLNMASGFIEDGSARLLFFNGTELKKSLTPDYGINWTSYFSDAEIQHELIADFGASEFITTDIELCSYESSTISASANSIGSFDVFDSLDGNLNYYIGYSNDNINYTWIATTRNSIPSVPGALYYKWKVEANTNQYTFIDRVRLNWWSGSGTDKYQNPITFYFDDPQILDANRVKTDELGGDTALINKVDIAATPQYVSPSTIDIWIGTYGQEPISPTNPLTINAGDLPYTIQVELEEPAQEASQSVVATWSSGGTGITLTPHPNNPTITITTAGILTELKIIGKPILKDAAINIIAEDTDSINKYGEANISIRNDYINQEGIAEAIASLTIARNSKPRELLDITIKLTPHIQLGEMFILSSKVFNFRFRCYVLELSHTLSASGSNFTAETKIKAIILEEIPYSFPLSALYLYVKEYIDYTDFSINGATNEIAWVWDEWRVDGHLMAKKNDSQVVVVNLPEKLVSISTVSNILILYSTLDEFIASAPLDIIGEVDVDGDGNTQIYYKSRTGDIKVIG